jgi:hypothetical protein
MVYLQHRILYLYWGDKAHFYDKEHRKASIIAK